MGNQGEATSATELAAMTPAERHADFESRVVDLSRLDALPTQSRQVASRLLDHARARAVQRIAREEGDQAAEEALQAIGHTDGAETRARILALISPGNTPAL